MRAAQTIYVVAAVVIVTVAVIASVLLFQRPRDRSLARLREKGVVRIGYAAERPHAFITDTGRVTGEAPEVAREIVDRLDIPEIEWVYTEFGQLIVGLESKHYDVIAAGMFITEERARRVDFSNPSVHVIQALLVREGNPHELHSYEQVPALPQVKVAVLTGSVEETMFTKLGLPEDQLIVVPDARAGRAAVETGVADALAFSHPTIKKMARKGDGEKTEIADPFYQPIHPSIRHLGYAAFAFRKEERALLDAWNRKMEEFIGTPEHIDLISRFGYTEANLPGEITTEELLSHD